MAVNEIARVYASSLVEFGQEKRILPDLEEEMKFLADLVSEDRDLRLFLVTPGIPKENKRAFVEKVFSGKLSTYMINFLKVLIDNDRQTLIPDIYQAMIDAIDVLSNRQRVQITSAFPMDEATKQMLTARLKEVVKKDVIIQEKVNPEILGGIIIKIGDTVIDGSISKDLKNIRHSLLQSKVRSEAAYED